jgi:peptidoglycan hydrolase-like protein with peptidoglycan-binding domain
MKKYSIAAIVLGTCLSLSSVSAQVTNNLNDGDPSNDSCVSLQTSVLRYKSTDRATGGEVSILQDFLVGKGYLSGAPTGFYGRLTVVAVKQYQKSIGVSATGNVGPLTRSIIEKETCDGSVSVNPTPPTDPTPMPPMNPCTLEYRACQDGSRMPRDPNCTWRSDKCAVSNTAPVITGVYPNRAENLLSAPSNTSNQNTNQYMIMGDHFNETSNEVGINGVIKTLPATLGASNFILFSLSDFNITTGGTYYVYVKTSNGVSNSFAMDNSATSQAAASLQVISLSDGKPLFVGQNYTACWKNAGSVKDMLMDVSLEYLAGKGQPTRLLGQAHPSSGCMSFVMPNDMSGATLLEGSYDILIENSASGVRSRSPMFTVRGATQQDNSSPSKEVLIVSYMGNITETLPILPFGSLLRVEDASGKVWNVEYRSATFLESWITSDGEHTRSGDFPAWLKSVNSQYASGAISGVPGTVKIKGTVDAGGVVHATSINQHVQ